MSDAARPRYHLLKAYGLSEARLRAAVESDPAVRADAEAEVAAAALMHEDRCHMARDYAAALKRALVSFGSVPLVVKNSTADIGPYRFTADEGGLSIKTPDGGSIPLVVETYDEDVPQT